MSKQLHIRLEDNVFDELSDYANENGQSVQNCVSGVLIRMLSQQKSQKKVDASFTFIDLFAGIGGMRIAFDHAGGHCVYSSEWNKYSQQTYLANFGEQPEGDITQVSLSPLRVSLKSRALAERPALKIKRREHYFLMCVEF